MMKIPFLTIPSLLFYYYSVSNISSTQAFVTSFQTFSALQNSNRSINLTPKKLNHYNHFVLFSSNESNDEKLTIQILISDTGGGHRASANALRDALDALHPNQIHCDIVDIYTEYGPFWPLNAYPAIYKFMAEYSFLWKAFYEFGATEFGLLMNDVLLELFCFDAFKECLSRSSVTSSKRADMVVSVHPLTQELPLKILNYLDSNGASKVNGRTTPFVTVVTDLGGAHPTWFNPGVDKCFVPSDALYKCARDRKVQSEQIVQYGLPIRRGFWGGSSTSSASIANEVDKTALRTKLQIEADAETLTVLVVGGGDGMGGIIETAKCMGDKLHSVATNDKKFQMIVVCGKNENAKNALSNYSWGNGVNVVVKGFVNNMDEWMRASDVLVTKAGPGTIAEASICGLPCMLSSYLPGQEEGNVPYVEENGFGTYNSDPVVIADTVVSWLESPEMLRTMQDNALKASRPNATIDIAKDLADILFTYAGSKSR